MAPTDAQRPLYTEQILPKEKPLAAILPELKMPKKMLKSEKDRQVTIDRTEKLRRMKIAIKQKVCKRAKKTEPSQLKMDKIKSKNLTDSKEEQTPSQVFKVVPEQPGKVSAASAADLKATKTPSQSELKD